MHNRISLLFAALFLFCFVCSDRTVEPIANAALTQSLSPTPSIMPTPAQTPKLPVDYFEHLSPEHKEIVKFWLKSQPNFRPASENADSGLIPGNDREWPEGNIKFLRETVGENGNQYYAVGDMNQDGKTDFAVLLVDTKKPSGHDVADEFALAVFNAPLRAGSSPAYFEKQLRGISNCYIVYDLMEKNHLFLGRFESDVYCATYYRKGKTYSFKDCL